MFDTNLFKVARPPFLKLQLRRRWVERRKNINHFSILFNRVVVVRRPYITPKEFFYVHSIRFSSFRTRGGRGKKGHFMCLKCEMWKQYKRMFLCLSRTLSLRVITLAVAFKYEEGFTLAVIKNQYPQGSKRVKVLMVVLRSPERRKTKK